MGRSHTHLAVSEILRGGSDASNGVGGMDESELISLDMSNSRVCTALVVVVCEGRR